MRVARAILAGVLRTIAAVLTYLAGWGYIQLLHGTAAPGPRTADAAPLYENAGADAMPIVLVAAVWLGVATIVYRLAGPRLGARAGATVALIGVGVGVQALQLELVRQSTLGLDVTGALHCAPTWIAAAAACAPALASLRGPVTLRWRSERPDLHQLDTL